MYIDLLDLVGEQGEELGDFSSLFSELRNTVSSDQVKTSTVKVGSTTYRVATAPNKSGLYTKYYFDSKGSLKRLEFIAKDGTADESVAGSSIIEISSLTTPCDDNYFSIKGYRKSAIGDLTKFFSAFTGGTTSSSGTQSVVYNPAS